jgi:hypothetical protein
VVVDHGGGHILAPQPFLHGSDIVAVFFEGMRGKRSVEDCIRVENRRLKTVEQSGRLGPAEWDEIDGAALGIHGETLRWIIGRFRPTSLELWGN